jgi:hypothetical protein
MSGDHKCEVCQRSFRWGSDADSHLAVAAAGESCASNAYWKLKGHMQAEHPGVGHMCPRRSESPMRRDGPDWWGTSDGYRACSYCGSMHPDDLFAAIDAGAHIGGTHKSYKIYVDVPHPDAGKPCVVSSANFKFSPKAVQLTKELCDEHGLGSYERQHYIGKWVEITPRGSKAHGKFYYQHFDGDQQQRFIDLYNEKKLYLDQFGLYVAPYFATRAK